MRPVLVLCSEFAKIKVDIILREVVMLTKLVSKLFNMELVLLLCASTFIQEFSLPACLFGLKGRVGSLSRLDMCRLR